MKKFIRRKLFLLLFILVLKINFSYLEKEEKNKIFNKEYLSTLSINELKNILKEINIECNNCTEKSNIT